MSCADQHLSQGQPEPASKKNKKIWNRKQITGCIRSRSWRKIKYTYIWNWMSFFFFPQNFIWKGHFMVQPLLYETTVGSRRRSSWSWLKNNIDVMLELFGVLRGRRKDFFIEIWRSCPSLGWVRGVDHFWNFT